MNLPYTKQQILKTITIDGKNVVSDGDLLGIFMLLETGKITRKMAWQIIRMVHEEELNCPLSIYGTLSVFSLAKDKEEFKRLYRQGCELLTDEGIVEDGELLPDDIEEEIYNEIAEAIKNGKFVIKKIVKTKKKDDDFKFPDSDRFKGLN